MRKVRQIGPNQCVLQNESGENTHLITKKGPRDYERMTLGRYTRRTRHLSLADAIDGKDHIKRQVAEGCYVV